MRGRWRLHAALLTSAAGLSAVLIRVFPGGAAEWLFGTVMLYALLLVLDLGLTAWRDARVEAARTRRLLAVDPGAAAARAVAEERRRLAVDVEATIRDALEAVLVEVDTAATAADPTPALHRVQEHARRATSELRRQLGLLRVDPRQGEGAVEEVPSPVAGAVTRRDLVLAALAALLAGAESLAYAPSSALQTGSYAGTAALSAAAALTFAGRRGAPAAAAAVCAGLLVTGSLVGTPLSEGFWFVIVVGSLTWTLAARGSVAGGTPALAALVVAAVGTRLVDSQENVGVVAVTVGVALAGGLQVRWGASRRRAAVSTAGGRQRELSAAVDLAVGAERASVARELHDVVSHAVGLISVQANAGLVSWPDHPEAVRRSLAVIGSTARETLGELGRLPADGRTATTGDLPALVDRIRAAGTPVELTVEGTPDPDAAQVAYRVVQEALTNVVRHAPGARAAVTVHADPGGTTVRVRDDGPGSVAGTARGYGLVGLTERVGLAGGRLSTGPGADGRGFVVEAVLPAADREPAT